MIERIVLRNKQLIVGDPAMESVIEDATLAARCALPVLLCGESGTGKELVARFIHEKSARGKGPFIAINCAAIPEGLMEAELFGYEKGAFTGALYQRIGKCELASGGTLLLDEISEMPLHLQAKLLRVIQEREIDRLGARDAIKIDIRIIATSNKVPELLVEEKKFREDLYYRLNVIRINCPNLKGRTRAINRLALHFLEEQNAASNVAVKLQPEALEKLKENDWLGNVRELENVIGRSFIRSNGEEISPADIRFEKRSVTERQVHSNQTLFEVEREAILGAVEKAGGNRTSAAKNLGISIRTLRNKLKEYRQE